MKLLIFKLEHGEYDDAYETIDSIYSTENADLTAVDLTNEFNLFINKKAKEWKIQYKSDNGKNPPAYKVNLYLSDNFKFKTWLAENYPDLVEIKNICEGYLNENYV